MTKKGTETIRIYRTFYTLPKNLIENEAIRLSKVVEISPTTRHENHSQLTLKVNDQGIVERGNWLSITPVRGIEKLAIGKTMDRVPRRLPLGFVVSVQSPSARVPPPFPATPYRWFLGQGAITTKNTSGTTTINLHPTPRF